MNAKEILIASALVFVAYSMVKQYYETQESKRKATWPSESRYVGIWQSYQRSVEENPTL